MSVIAFKLPQTDLIELERGKRIRYHRMEFGRNLKQMCGKSNLRASDVNSGPFFVYEY